MKIIFNFGTEVKLFDKENRVYKRIREYAIISDLYYNFTFTLDIKFKDYRSIDSNFINISVYGSNKFTQIYNLFKIVKREFKYLNISNKITNTEKEKTEIYFSSQDPFEIGLFTLILSKIYKAKFIVQMHTDTSSGYFKNESMRNYMQYLISLFIFKKADRIRVVSDRMKIYLIEKLKINKQKIYNLPVYIDISKFIYSDKRESALEPKRDIDFLVLCRIEKVKNIELAIDSVYELNRQNKNSESHVNKYNLKIVGSGSHKKYLQEKYKSNEYSFIIWQDYTQDVVSEYRNAKYFLLTSYYEGYGLTAVEASLSGCIVIMTDVGCGGDFILDSVNGFIVKSFEVSKFVKTLRSILEINSNKHIGKREDNGNILNLEEYRDKLKNFYMLLY